MSLEKRIELMESIIRNLEARLERIENDVPVNSHSLRKLGIEMDKQMNFGRLYLRISSISSSISFSFDNEDITSINYNYKSMNELKAILREIGFFDKATDGERRVEI